MKKDKECCKELNYCVFGRAEGCKKSETFDCDEFKRRETLMKMACPVMEEHGYKKNLCECDVPQLRALVPVEINCSIEGKCIREICPDLNDVAEKINRKEEISRVELLSVLKNIKNHLQIAR